MEKGVAGRKVPSFFRFFLCYLAIQVIVGQPAVTRLMGPLFPPAWWFLLGSWGVLLVCLAALAPSLLERDGLRAADLGRVFPVARGDVFFGLACGGGIFLLKEAYRRAVAPFVAGAVANVPLTQVFHQLDGSPLSRAGFLAGVVIVGPLAEEVVFSAYALTSMERVWGKTPWRTAGYVLLSSALFSAMHVTGHPLYSLGYLLTGVLFRLVYARSRSLPAAFLAHAAVNLLGEAF